jgi:subtilisin
MPPPVPSTHEDEELPAWSSTAALVPAIDPQSGWPAPITRDWAWGGSTGAGVQVCVIDSGVDGAHPFVGKVSRSIRVQAKKQRLPVISEDDVGDACGHGTACAGIIHSIAPDCEISSVKVLGAGYKGSGRVLVAGLRWALQQGFDVINLSLSTSKREVTGALRELTDSAYFRRRVLVAAAHNLAVDSYPWRFSSVISVGSHDEADPFAFYYNPSPPVEFFARGVDVEVAWMGGATIRSTGNSFASPHIAAICALILAKHRELTPFQLKGVLQATATNAGAAGGAK